MIENIDTRKLAIIIAIPTIGLPILFLNSDLLRTLNMNSDKFFNPELYFVPIMSLLIGFSAISYAYLKPENSQKENTNYDNESINNIKNELLNIKSELALYSENKGLTEDDKKEILDGAMNSLSENSIKNIFKEEASLLQISIEKDLNKKNLKNLFDTMIERLKIEIREINKRSMYNLIIGGAITVLGIIILSFILFEIKHEIINIGSNQEVVKDYPMVKDFKTEDIIKLIPTFSLILFIELFAYFFLSLYRNGLNEMKYFQNELTNIESKLIAVEVAYITKNEEVMKDALKVLVQTERNFILKKGETTVELERAKSESENMQNILKAVPEIFKNKGK